MWTPTSRLQQRPRAVADVTDAHGAHTLRCARMLEVTAAGWAATLGLIGALFFLDLFVSGRRPHAVGFREATL